MTYTASLGCEMESKLPRGWASREYPGHNVHIPGTTNYLRSRTFQSWFNLIVRCHYPSHAGYNDYGARGIRVCSKWLNSFDAFLEDMGHRPAGTTIDRIDVDGNYEPSNCQWSTKQEQEQNKRRNKKAA